MATTTNTPKFTERPASPSRSLIGRDGIRDYREYLLTLPGGDNSGDGAIELPPADPRFDLFASTDHGREWGVNAYLTRDTASPADCAAIAAAFIKAAMEVEALNSTAAIAIPAQHRRLLIRAKPARGMLVRGEEPTGWTTYTFGGSPESLPGDLWGDDGYYFEACGHYQHIGTDVIDGTMHAILVAEGS